jgi:hypothetical protein
MKKVGAYFVLALIALVFVSSFVSAANAGDALKPIVNMVGGAVNAVIEIIKPWAGTLLNEPNTAVSNDVFMGKLLAVILIISIIYVVLSKTMDKFFSGKKWALWLVSAVVSLLGVRFLTEDMIYMSIIPSSTFAVAVSAGIPFVLYFFLIGDFSQRLRRYAWIFFAVIFTGLWMIRTTDSAKQLNDAALMIYPVTAGLATLMAWLDGTLRGFIERVQSDKAQVVHYAQRLVALEKDLNQVQERYNARILAGTSQYYTSALDGRKGQKAYESDVKYYENEINNVKKLL